jgi:hypothetical protein
LIYFGDFTMSKFIELSEFVEEKGISAKTLKRRYGDIIHREGKKSFIDSGEFDKAFAERSRKGRKNPRSITTSTSVLRIERVIDSTKVKITRLESDIDHLKDVEKNAKPGRAKKLVQIDVAQAVNELVGKKSFVQKLEERADDLIDQQLRKLGLAKASAGDAK